MKKQFFYSMLAGAAMLASCSSENVVAPDAGGNEYGIVEGQPAFIALGIAMPDAPSTRANDDFHDGSADEYAVKSGKLVLFKGTTEASATLFGTYDIPTSTVFNLEGTTDQITSTSAKFVQEINAPNLTGAEKLYAYVILNPENNTTGITYTIGDSFENFSKMILTAIGIKDESMGYGEMNEVSTEKTGFVMTNVPVSTAAAGSSAPAAGTVCTTLAPIAATAVYPTKAQAEASAAQVACIYVERAAVKVEVGFTATTASTADGTLPAKLEGWALGNTNSSASGYYNTRQVENDWLQLYNEQCATAAIKYRFASVAPLFASGHDMGYRTYWAKDVNYSGKSGLNNTVIPDAQYTLTNNAVTYTYENTFDENSQIYANTTYVGFKTTLNNGTTFYTIDGANNSALSLADLKTKLGANAAAQLAAVITDIKTTIASKVGASTTVTLAPAVTLGSKVAATGKLSGYTVKLAITGVTGTLTQTEVEALEYTSGKTIAQKLDEALVGYTPDVVNEYTDGVTYYATRIAHFGDNETPWNTEAASYNQYDKIYPMDGQALGVTPNNYGASRKAAWLGRWGIVRNNWYKLEVTTINGIGDAVPVDYSVTGTGNPGDTPDDNPKPKYYIAAHIHILPWVLRTQHVEL